MIKSQSMKTIIVGAGASGIAAAINLKRKNANEEVLIIEHLDKPLKKILATGNGKCNLGHKDIDFSVYNNPIFAEQIIKDYNYEKFFDSVGIKTKVIDNLAYPVSESAVSVREALLNECRKLHVLINVDEEFIDYEVGENIQVITNKKTYICDKLVLSGGLKSSPKQGSDGSVIEILRKHNYKIATLNPGLSPLLTIEKTKLVDGVRVKGIVTLNVDGKEVHKESGEILFKDHGLSGIVVFNTMSLISRQNSKNVKLYVDLLPDYEETYINDYLKNHSLDDLLLAFVNPKITAYLKDRFSKDSDIIKALKRLEFTFAKSYGFDFSQVTVGGIETSEVNTNLMSNKEKNVYIIGELVNIDGPCGGYNLTWAFASGLKI